MTGKITTANAVFRQQIKDDISLIQEKMSGNPKIEEDSYAFNYWILSKIYNLDEDVAESYITEYNDKGIDCFVHYEEDKELYIIQNKYYSENTKLKRGEVSDFLKSPLAHLNDGTYKKSAELQKIYSMAAKDSEYKVFLHFFVSNDNENKDVTLLMKDHNRNENVIAKMFYLSDIKEKYYGKSYRKGAFLNFELSLKDESASLKIDTDEDGLENIKAFYVRAKVQDIHDLYAEAEGKEYPLFEKNIREYLGDKSGINKGITNTLKSKERHKFFYYNNGITIICKKAERDSSCVKLTNPQVVNGCQTVRSIYQVLHNADLSLGEFEKVYVMTKIFVVDVEKKDKEAKEHNKFYRDIVLYTNSQNSINEKVFGAIEPPFFTIQEEIKERGFLLCVKQSDKNTFNEEYNENKRKWDLLKLAKETSKEFYPVKRISDVQINIEHLLQIIGAFVKDAYFAYMKKPLLLRKGSTEHEDFSLRIYDMFTTQQMVNLIILYKRAERDRRSSQDTRTPIPYYLLNFLGFYLRQEKIELRSFLQKVTIDQLESIYEEFKHLSTEYSKKYVDRYGKDYTQMVKLKVDESIMQEVLKETFEGMKRFNSVRYKEIKAIFSESNF